jgi:hypothetical protein
MYISILSLSPGLGDREGKKENLFLQNIGNLLKKSQFHNPVTCKSAL